VVSCRVPVQSVAIEEGIEITATGDFDAGDAFDFGQELAISWAITRRHLRRLASSKQSGEAASPSSSSAVVQNDGELDGYFRAHERQTLRAIELRESGTRALSPKGLAI
jgi:hypothetical protein